MKPITMTRAEVAEILKRFRGSKKQLAEDLGLSKQAITSWIRGKASQRIERAATARAIELLTGCTDADKLCLPCPLRPVCERLAAELKGQRKSRKGTTS